MGIIFLTIPFARTMQNFLESEAGPHFFLIATGIVGLVFVLAVLIGMFRGSRARIRSRLGWLAALCGLSAWVLFEQLQTSVEAVHFTEYGLLGFLIFRAWRRSVADPLIYPISALSLALVAWLDEFLQWLTPARFWDYRDIRLNLMAGTIVLAFIALVIPPAGIRSPVGRRSIRWLCCLAWTMLLALGISISNTPKRVDWYAARIPFLRFLYNNESVMTEFGYRHIDPKIGTFYSRLTLPELLRIDCERGAAAGGILVRNQAFADHRKFLKAFPVSADPFLYELLRHSIQRDHYYAVSWKYQETDPARFVNHLTVAMRENQILEKYFSHASEAAGNCWGADKRAQCAGSADWATLYVSEVGNHLVVAVTESELWLILLVLSGWVGWGYVRLGREPALAREET